MTITFTISARGKSTRQPIGSFLADHYAAVPRSSIDSVFGFVARSPLYGGRPFVMPELSESDVAGLETWGVGLRLPLTNKFVSGVIGDGPRFGQCTDTGNHLGTSEQI